MTENNEKMPLVDDAKNAWKKEGLAYIIKQSPRYIKRKARESLQEKLYFSYDAIDRDRLKSICKTNGAVWHYGSRTELEISQPLTGGTPELFQDLVGSHTVPRSFVCEMPDIRLLRRRALCQTKNGEYILEEMGTESMLRSRVAERFESLTLQEKVRELTRTSHASTDADYDVLINMVPRHGESHNNFINYGHWLTEDLPRLRAYEHYHENTGRKPTLLVKNDPPSWMIDTLQLLGFSSEDWVEWDNREAVVSRLVIPKLSYIHSVGAQFQPSDRNWVSEQMKSRVDLSVEREFPERLFVSRQGQGRRRIINFDEVTDTVREYGFEAVRTEELSVKDQIRLFDQAEIIVGPFGASLVNMIFTNDASLIEIKPHATEHTVYYILANESGLRYDYIHGKSAEEDGGGSNKDSDILVDTDELVEVIQNIL